MRAQRHEDKHKRGKDLKSKRFLVLPDFTEVSLTCIAMLFKLLQVVLFKNLPLLPTGITWI